jgi:integrase
MRTNPTARIPSYRLHKSSGRAVVTVNGRDIVLGKHGTPESRRKYDRVIAEWISAGRQLPVAPEDLTVLELIARFWTHAEATYRKPDGRPTSELDNFRQALRPLKGLYADTAARLFGPRSLRAVQSEMVRIGWRRTSVNKHIGRVKHVFKWATAHELIPPNVYHGLATVDGLRRGRSDAPESDPVRPVPEAYVDAVLPLVSRQIAAMIRLQLLTGMRPGEVVAMRTADIDTAGKLWVYTPESHKTEHHGHARTIYLGPQAIEVLRPFLRTDLAAPLFSPAAAEAERREAAHAARKTPLKYGNRPGTNCRGTSRIGDRYTVTSYRAAIRRASDRADAWAKGGLVIANDERVIPRWHPHRLRHNAATFLRRTYGLEAAQVILGHKTLSVTEIYAEKNVEAAKRIMAEVG